MRGQYEQVGVGICLAEFSGVHLTGEPHPPFQLQSLQLCAQAGDRIRVTGEAADTGQMPGDRPQCRERGEQQVVAFARNEGGHAQQLQRRAARAPGERRGIGSGLHDRDPGRFDSQFAQPLAGDIAGHDDVTDCRQRQPLGARQFAGDFWGEPAFGSQLMVNQRHQMQARSVRLRDLRHRAEREPVDEYQRLRRQIRQHAPCMLERCGVGLRKTRIQRMHRHLPAKRPQLRDDPAVIAVAAGARLEVSRNEEVQRARARHGLIPAS